MKWLILILFGIFLSACGKIRYVPVETIRDNYITNYTRDSIYLRDSVSREVVRGDTVTITTTAYRYLYKDKIVRDTVLQIDSIPYPVEVRIPGPVTNVLTSWQAFQVWSGRIGLAVIALVLGVWWIRKRVGL
jgi:hypothetical protein